MKLARFASNSIRGFGGNLSIGTIGNYFWSTSEQLGGNDWGNINHWWYDENHIIQANLLPTSQTSVTILPGSVIPFVELSAANWVEPFSINAGNVGIVFYSGVIRSVTCNVATIPPAAAVFAGNAQYNFLE